MKTNIRHDKISDKICQNHAIRRDFSILKKFSPIEHIIDSELGLRSKLYGYQYGEIIRTMMCTYLCGGDRIEDSKIYQTGIEYMPGVKLCSPDTVLRAINELTTDNASYLSEFGKEYEYNTADRLNRLEKPPTCLTACGYTAPSLQTTGTPERKR